MKKAIITTCGKQYVVAEGDSLEVELLGIDKKTVEFEPLLVIADNKTVVGTPVVKDASVSATIEAPDNAGEKVTAIRYKSKKRVHTVRGHRQRKAHITIKTIAVK